MKELLLYRHAQAEKPGDEMADAERPLSDDGRKQARRQGQLLVERGLLPDHIASSEALRASQTVRETVGVMRYTGKVNYLPALYDADPDTYYALLKKQPKSIRRLMIVGHNPGIEEFASDLSSESIHMKAGSIACFAFETDDWTAIVARSGGRRRGTTQKEGTASNAGAADGVPGVLKEIIVPDL